MSNIFQSAKSILEQSGPSQAQLDALTKVLLSMKQSYSSINAVRSKLDNPAGSALLDVVSIIARNTSLFNAFVAEFKKEGFSESVEDAIELTLEEQAILNEDKLQNDIKSLKKIGWKLDKIQKFLITKGDDYGVKMTSDLIAMYYNEKEKTYVKDKDGKDVTLPGTNIKIVATKQKPVKRPSWPKDPPKSKINDPSHAEAYLAQAIAADGSVDSTGTEAYQILDHAGYSKKAILWVIKNMGWDDADFMRQAKRNNWL